MTKRIFKNLEYCANGDGNKVCPPSKVICRECMDKISDTLTKLSNQLEEVGGEDGYKRGEIDCYL